MSGNTNDLNQQLVEAVNFGQQAVMSQNVIKASGAGKAYQSVAQSTAIAVQDAADNLRNMGIISTTAAGVAMAQILATGDPQGTYTKAIATATALVSDAATNFSTIGKDAAEILSAFPSS